MRSDELTGVAALHAACLPDSLVGALGPRFVRAFYAHVSQSPQEVVVESRDDGGRIVGIGVVSLAPATLTRRLALRTPLLPSLILHPRVALSYLQAALVPEPSGTGPGDSSAANDNTPELILLFTEAAVRSQGRGTALVHDVEDRLRARGIATYQVKTEAEPSNPALRFYKRLGFQTVGTAIRMGTTFEVLAKDLT